MGDTVARVLGGMALVGIVANLALTCRVERAVSAPTGAAHERVANAEFGRAAGTNAAEFVRSAGAHRAAKASRLAAGGEAKAGADEGGRRERREKFENAWREAAIGEVEAFGEELSIEPALVEQVLDEILSMTDATGAVREEMRSGGMAPAEGRDEIRALKEASDARLDELLGATNADALRERLREGRPF